MIWRVMNLEGIDFGGNEFGGNQCWRVNNFKGIWRSLRAKVIANRICACRLSHWGGQITDMGKRFPPPTLQTQKVGCKSRFPRKVGSRIRLSAGFRTHFAHFANFAKSEVALANRLCADPQSRPTLPTLQKTDFASKSR